MSTLYNNFGEEIYLDAEQYEDRLIHEQAWGQLMVRLENRRRYEEAKTGKSLFWDDLKFVNDGTKVMGHYRFRLTARLMETGEYDGIVDDTGTFVMFANLRPREVKRCRRCGIIQE